MSSFTQKRVARKRSEFIRKRLQDAQERGIWERKQAVKDALALGQAPAAAQRHGALTLVRHVRALTVRLPSRRRNTARRRVCTSWHRRPENSHYDLSLAFGEARTICQGLPEAGLATTHLTAA